MEVCNKNWKEELALLEMSSGETRELAIRNYFQPLIDDVCAGIAKRHGAEHISVGALQIAGWSGWLIASQHYLQHAKMILKEKSHTSSAHMHGGGFDKVLFRKYIGSKIREFV